MEFGIKDKTALITGGSKGLGRAAALSLAKEGVTNIAPGGKHFLAQLRKGTTVTWGSGGDIPGHFTVRPSVRRPKCTRSEFITRTCPKTERECVRERVCVSHA